MADKTLKTRIQLKYDTLAAWNSLSDDKILKAGEVAAVAIPENTTTDGNGKVITTAPTTLFKVGDGTSTFKNLPWLSALAADVHAWAKDDWETFIAKVDTALSTGSVAYLKVTDFDAFKSTTIGTSSDELTATTVFGKIAELEDIADAADKLSKTNKAALEILNGADTVEGSVAAQVKVAKDAADNAQARADEAYNKAEANATAISKLDEIYATDVELTTAKNTLQGNIDKKANIDDVYSINAADAKFETIANVDAIRDDVAELQTWTTTNGATKTDVADAKDAVIGKTTDDEAADTIRGAKKYTDKAIENFVAAYITEDNNGAIDKLNEVTAWIVDNEDGAAGMMADIDELQSKVSTLEGSNHTHANKAELDKIVDGDKAKWDAAAGKAHEHTNKTVLDGITAEKVAAWDSAEADAIAKATELNDAMNTRVTELEKVDHEHTSSLADIEDAVAKRHEHTNKTVLDGITSDKVANWDAAEQNAKTHANSLNDAMNTRVSDIEAEYIRVGSDDKMYLGETETVLIISGGSASDVW